MSTHACVAKPDGEAIDGRYVHFDGYPSGLGVTLIEGLERFDGDLVAMTTKLIDNERVGWSVLAGIDLTEEPTWRDYSEEPSNSPLSYSARGETNELIITSVQHAADCGCDWLYVLRPEGIAVYNLERKERYLGVVAWGDTAAMNTLNRF